MARCRGATPPSSSATRTPRVRLRVRQTDRADNTFQRLEVVRRNRTKRHRYGEALVEGVRPITRALQQRWEARAFAYAAGRPLSRWAWEMLETAPEAERIELAPHLMERLSGKEDPSELLLVVRQPPDDLARIPLGRAGGEALVCVFERPVSPGNLGTVIRSCDALGADGLIVTGHGCDVYDPQTIAASQGSLFSLPVVRASGPSEVRGWVTERLGKRAVVLGASGDGDAVLHELDLTGPVVLVLGNETQGLSQGYRAVCDTLVRIPMPGQPSGAADSLNVASAAAILLYEVSRQRSSQRAATT